MQMITEASALSPPSTSRVLTIGNFDGVHLGHQHLLHHARTLATEEGEVIVYTFLNHPTHVLSHLPPTPWIYTIEHKLKILEEIGVNYTLLITFTKELAQTPYDTFLEELKRKLHFTHLVLGKGASLGKGKQGDEPHVRACAERLGFHVSYVSKLGRDDLPLSSGQIRRLIAEAALEKASHCLGRPYSIYAPLLLERSLCMRLQQHCLPPSGIYSIHLNLEEENYKGKAFVERPEMYIRIKLDDAPALPAQKCNELIFA